MKIKQLLGGLMAMTTLTTCAFAAVGCSTDSAQGANVNQAQTGGIFVDEGKNNGISLMATTISAEDYEEYGVAATAESAFQITATITPANATNQKVDWSLSYKDPTSQYVGGSTTVTEVTVTPTGDGALTAIVACLSEFGEPIIITVTSRENTAIKATCQCDYLRRVDGINSVSLSGGASSQTAMDGVFVNAMHLDYPSNGKNEIDAIISFDDLANAWTIGNDYQYGVTLEFTDEFVSALETQGFTVQSGYANKITYIHNLAANIIKLIDDADEQDLDTYGKCDFRSFVEGYYDEALYAAFGEFGEGAKIGTITFAVQFEDGVIDEVTRTYDIVIGADCINTSVQSISLSDSELTF